MSFTSQILTSLTEDVELDINDVQNIVPVLQEVDTILAAMEARLSALETAR